MKHALIVLAAVFALSSVNPVIADDKASGTTPPPNTEGATGKSDRPQSNPPPANPIEKAMEGVKDLFRAIFGGGKKPEEKTGDSAKPAAADSPKGGGASIVFVYLELQSWSLDPKPKEGETTEPLYAVMEKKHYPLKAALRMRSDSPTGGSVEHVETSAKGEMKAIPYGKGTLLFSVNVPPGVVKLRGVSFNPRPAAPGPAHPTIEFQKPLAVNVASSGAYFLGAHRIVNAAPPVEDVEGVKARVLRINPNTQQIEMNIQMEALEQPSEKELLSVLLETNK